MNQINNKVIEFKNLITSKHNDYMKRNNFSEICACDFELSEGKKYFKIIKASRIGSSKSVHSFINKENGNIFKAASYKSPAKHSRGNIFNNSGADALSCYQIKYLK